MAIKVLEQSGLKWINIDRVDEEAITYLRDEFHFHELDLEDVAEESQTPKIDTYNNYLFIILQFPHWHGTKHTVTAQEVDVFLGDGYLITIQSSKSKQIKNFFYRCMKNSKIKKDWMSGSSGYLFYKLIEALYHNTRPILNNIGRTISDVEKDVFEEEQDTDIVKALAILRRNILGFRRIIDPQRYMISTLAHTRKPFLEEELNLYFDDVVDYLNKLWAYTNTYKDTVAGLHVTVESLINHRTNKVISALTVISVSLLPLTLLAGLYGMNIPLPYDDQPGFVWMMFLGLAGFIILSILYMRRKKML